MTRPRVRLSREWWMPWFAMCTAMTDSPPACRSLAPFWVISVPNRTVFERAIELAAVIGGKRQALVQAPREVRVADKIPSIKQAIVGLCCVPCVLIVEATSREEWCVGEDRTESRQIDGMQTPGIEEFLFISGAVDLFVSLIGGGQIDLLNYENGDRDRNRLTGSTKLT